MKTKKNLILLVSFFAFVFLFTGTSHIYYLKKDYSQKVNFLIAKREVRINGYCNLYDKSENELPLKSYSFYKSQIYSGDSIVKIEDSYTVYVFRKKSSDSKYYIVEQIQLD